MTSNEQQRELDLFHEVLDQPADQRASFVAKRHAENPALIERLHRLLAAHERAECSDNNTAAFANAHHRAVADDVPEWIGPYRVLEMIGEGGMGVVYAAEQTEPVRRRVAVKVIKLGMDTKEVIARFEGERQALAMLDHPGIAKVFDAGSTSAGRPYFVMELVKGLPFTEYCDKQKLELHDRLHLFMQVCDTVQHAHHRGIIHRDLKPSNVLISVQEGRPTPKIIDFGVAKATASRLSEHTVFTELGKLIGTPEYMSPEQADMAGLDVDTRSDIYSLGVMLYELVTGVLPFDSKQLRAGGVAEIQHLIRDVDPPRPSTRVSKLARDSSGPSRNYGALARRLRGELDWIVMRAMNKDRTRRYESASDLCRDIERYLGNQPVLAGPPSAAYAIRKFVRRHWFVTALIALACVSGVVGVTGLTIGLLRARQAETLAKQRADNEQAASAFLEQMLFQADPEFGGGSLTLEEVMDIAAQSVSEELGPYPAVEASVRESIGVAYRRRSMFVAAAPHLRRSLELRRELFGDDHAETARSNIAMADLRFEYEGDITNALELLGKSHHCYASLGLLGTESEAWLQLDIGIINLAGDHLLEAECAFEKCRALLAKYRGPEHSDVSRPVRGLALVALQRGNLEEAGEIARQAVALCEGEGAEYIGARAKQVLAQVLLEADRIDEASGILDSMGDMFGTTVGSRHIRVAERYAILAELHLRQGEFGPAAVIAERCEAMRRQILHEDHWAIREAQLLRLRAQIGSGETSNADRQLLEISSHVARLLGDDHPLMIAVAKVRLEYAHALGDASLAAVRAERLASLQTRRDARLEAIHTSE